MQGDLLPNLHCLPCLVSGTQHSMSLLSWFQPVPEVSNESGDDDWSPNSCQGLESNLLIPFLASDDEDSESDTGVDANSSIENKGNLSFPNMMSNRVKVIAQYVDELDYDPKIGVNPTSLEQHAKAAQGAGKQDDSEWQEFLILRC